MSIITPKLILASHNQHKLEELKNIISQILNVEIKDGEIVSSADLGLIEPIEDGASFEENALIKARSVFKQTGISAIADDSGLIVDVLGNAPGILSARWSGKHGHDRENNLLLLNQLKDLPDNLRKAHFVCAVALIKVVKSAEKIEDVIGDSIVKVGKMTGKINYRQKGKNGFGYDSIFIPDAYRSNLTLMGKTSAELTAEEKNKISHRTYALLEISKELKGIFNA
ncbi:MAG: RdgB/HAM1 family non-canonical purine NTP pyrophosphatase [Candidatus Ancillula sp.]|jgi:XTP/dITP diphosphohydrolase|nr:RdgB/HAM1 family non-canonical purine NTP pyrophosphatase [Candidatus Ancillula sp.]